MRTRNANIHSTRKYVLSSSSSVYVLFFLPPSEPFSVSFSRFASAIKGTCFCVFFFSNLESTTTKTRRSATTTAPPCNTQRKFFLPGFLEKARENNEARTCVCVKRKKKACICMRIKRKKYYLCVSAFFALHLHRYT